MKKEVLTISLVSFVRVCSPSSESLKKAIKDSLDLVNFNFNRKLNKIVIKPNMCYYYHPSTGEVTDPDFVGALIDVLRKNLVGTSEISVVESDATAMKCKHAFKMLGYSKMAEEKGVALVNLSEEKNKCVEAEIHGSKFLFLIPEIFHETELVVNVPKPKYMKTAKISCALKNFYGCNAYQKKSIYHKVLDEAIVFINKQIRTDLVIFDGLMAVGKNTKRLNMIMSSKNPVAADAAASTLMGISPASVRQIALASKEGIGSMNFSPVGDFSYFKKNFPREFVRDRLRAKVASFYMRMFGA
jgi:uncharacterized protein (DUF362 family)